MEAYVFVLYRVYIYIYLLFQKASWDTVLPMNIKDAVQILIKAIKNVERRYIVIDGIPKTKIKKEQVERSFAYELYHQWSLLIEEYYLKHKEERQLILNGEITKHLDGQPTYPDMVFHGGQSNVKDQLIICELKRAEKKYPSPKKVCNDFEKLNAYLELTLPNGNDDAHYQQAVFIMVNESVCNLKSRIIKALKTSQKLNEIKENAERILCISYTPQEDSRKGEVNPETFLLKDILNEI